MLLGLSLGWNWHHLEQSLSGLAESEANAAFQKDVTYRLWAAMQGGVYVPPTGKTPPNPLSRMSLTGTSKRPQGKT